ncbi:hypothetical protein [Haladaptatus halobius]|uniref:hypothetical protein n=1 Tax=Haladaptatus halobius TaxID=2884875 RepID=UPI001D0ABA84|nr:hypothetical protein [Haladaptatus halobius]
MDPDIDTELASGTYYIEVNAPVKVYLRVDGALSVRATMERVVFEFDTSTVLVGARSYHHHPAATVTTTADPKDVLTALSVLSSALKTTTCERSYPTLRGHPPTIELGDELQIPDEITRAQTGIRFELPLSLQMAYVAAPLAYYLGAEMVPGDSPRLVADGFEYGFSNTTVEQGIERVLKQTFFLDCLTRTEGYYQVDLYEREQADLELDFEELYEMPITEQLPAYLSVPFDRIEPLLPQWPLTAHVSPTPEQVTAIPFIVHDLGLIRMPQSSPASADDIASFVLESFLGRTRGESDESPTFVRPEPTDSLEQAWFTDHVPLNATKALPQAFRNKLEREPKTGAIDISVVCNDAEMAADEQVEQAYRSRDELALDVTTHYDLSTTELRTVLESDLDFFHYVGHIDGNGFRCHDGWLDATTLTSVGFPTFLLNACQSYDQGVELIEGGAVGGVVTFSEVVDDGAARLGYSMARLLNLGFPLRVALALARRESIVGSHYIVIGDGSADVVQVDLGVPMICDIEPTGERYDVTLLTYPSREGKIGTMVDPLIETNDHYFLVPGSLRTFRLSAEAVRNYLLWYQLPVRKEGQLIWDDDPL